MNLHARKTIVALAGITSLTILLMADKVDPVAGLTGITGITMYILGNGVAAATGRDVQPVIKAAGDKLRRRSDDLPPPAPADAD